MFVHDLPEDAPLGTDAPVTALANDDDPARITGQAEGTGCLTRVTVSRRATRHVMGRAPVARPAVLEREAASLADSPHTPGAH